MRSPPYSARACDRDCRITGGLCPRHSASDNICDCFQLFDFGCVRVLCFPLPGEQDVFAALDCFLGSCGDAHLKSVQDALQMSVLVDLGLRHRAVLVIGAPLRFADEGKVHALDSNFLDYCFHFVFLPYLQYISSCPSMYSYSMPLTLNRT